MEVALTRLVRRSAYSPEQKATFKRTARKNVIFAEQSRNVYENKGNTDKMPGEESDIYGSLERNRLTFWYQDRANYANGGTK